MTKEKRTEGINLAWEGMEWAQFLIDAAPNQREMRLARAMYEAYWCLYQLLTDEQRQERRGNTSSALRAPSPQGEGLRGGD